MTEKAQEPLFVSGDQHYASSEGYTFFALEKDPFNICFYDGTKVIGKLIIEGGNMRFEELTEHGEQIAAQLFFAHVVHENNYRMKLLESIVDNFEDARKATLIKGVFYGIVLTAIFLAGWTYG